VWKFLSKTVGIFEFSLLEPKKNEISVLTTDKGPVLFPKLYRRFANWSTRNKAKVTYQTFQASLKVGPDGKPDSCFLTADFLANGVHSATHHRFDEFIESGKTIKFQPGGLVFKEAPSQIAHADGSPIADF